MGFFFFGGNCVLVCSGLLFVYLSSGCWKMFMLSRTMYIFNMEQRTLDLQFSCFHLPEDRDDTGFGLFGAEDQNQNFPQTG